MFSKFHSAPEAVRDKIPEKRQYAIASIDYPYVTFFVDCFLIQAEGEGFKPPIPGKGIPDFESSAFGHSANLPICKRSKSLF